MRRSVLAGVLAGLLAGTVGVAAASTVTGSRPLGTSTVGRQADGSVLTPVNQFLTPAGQQIRYDNGRLQDAALSPDGLLSAATAWTARGPRVVVFDLQNAVVRQEYAVSGTTGEVSITGMLWSPDGTHLWVALVRTLLDFPVVAGQLAAPRVVSLAGSATQSAIPADLAWAPDGRLLVTLNGTNTLALIDPVSGARVWSVRVGNAPRDVVVLGGSAYVSNQGGRVAAPTDFTDVSYGTPLVADSRNAHTVSGTVSKVDLATHAVLATFPTGLQPTSMVAHGTDLLVTNSNDDSVTVIDTLQQRVGVTFSVSQAPGRKYGASPNSLAFLDATHLAVSLGRANAVAVYGYAGPYAQPSFQGLIPTGWYPATVQWDVPLERLVVTSVKGYGALGPEATQDQGPGTLPATGHRTRAETGLVSLVPMPTAQTLTEGTVAVSANNQWDSIPARNAAGSATVPPVAVPVHIGDPSTIKHVFLIVKENRTYDQVLGDDPRGNGAPALAQFGGEVTPNAHALAQEFPLIDNLYGGGTLSADGHNWLTQAFVNDYIEREFGNFARSYPASGEDPLAYAKSGFLWDNVLRHGKRVRSWGEYANHFRDANGMQPLGSWAEWYHDSQVLEGKAPGPLHVPVGYYRASSDIPSLQWHLAPNFPDFKLQIPDQYRADLFLRDLRRYERAGGLPALSMMWLMTDHTAGTAPGFPIPRAGVADNDLAVGRVIDRISHSRFWRNSAVFVIEDDTQNGVDHVDGHRNIALVASPYARRGAVVHDYYTQLNLIRTIEQILGLPPMNSMDLAAAPMRAAFTNTPDFTPYTVKPNQIRLDTMSPPTAYLQGPARVWAEWAAKQDFTTEDMVNMAQLNRDIWYAGNDFTKPYPGDSRVLLPDEVPGANAPRSQQEDADG